MCAAGLAFHAWHCWEALRLKSGIDQQAAEDIGRVDGAELDLDEHFALQARETNRHSAQAEHTGWRHCQNPFARPAHRRRVRLLAGGMLEVQGKAGLVWKCAEPLRAL